MPLRAIVIVFLLFSCGKTIYQGKNSKGHTITHHLHNKKSGQYQLAFALHNNQKGYWGGFTILKTNCDSFNLQRHTGVGAVKFYTIARTGGIKPDFTDIELGLLADLRKIADSLGWCHSMLLQPDSLYMRERLTKRQQKKNKQ